MDIKTIEFSYRNDNGHKVYDFYPDRNFDDEIIFCPWIGEVKHHHMLAAVFAICDKANIKVSVLALEDHIPLFSFNSHSLICVSEDTVRLNSGTRRESEEKLRYFDKHSTDCYNKLYFEKRAIENGISWDINWGEYAKQAGIPEHDIANIVRKRDALLFMELLGEYNIVDLNNFDTKDITEFYKKRINDYNIFFTKNQMLSYENLINDLGIDDSPKIFSYIKNGKDQAKANIDKGHFSPAQNKNSTCRIRAGIEWVSSDIMGEAMHEVGEEIGHENIFNFDYKEFAKRRAPAWPFHNFLNQRENFQKKYGGSLSSIQVLLSLKNNWGYVSQAGASSILYLSPVNIIYAEHQHWWSQLKLGTEFTKRPFQNLYKNSAVYDSCDELKLNSDDCIIWDWDKKNRRVNLNTEVAEKITNEEFFNMVVKYVNENHGKEYFKKIFLDFYKGAL